MSMPFSVTPGSVPPAPWQAGRPHRGVRGGQLVVAGVERQHDAAPGDQQQVAAGPLHRLHAEAFRQRGDRRVALVLQRRGIAVAAVLHAAASARRPRAARRWRSAPRRRWRPAPAAAPSPIACETPFSRPASVSAAAAAACCLPASAGRRAQREEAGAQSGQPVRRGSGPLSPCACSMPVSSVSRSPAAALPARLASSRAEQRGIDGARRIGGAQPGRAVADGDRLLRHGLARVAGRVGIGDVLRSLREAALHRGQAAAGDQQGGVEAHGGLSRSCPASAAHVDGVLQHLVRGGTPPWCWRNRRAGRRSAW